MPLISSPSPALDTVAPESSALAKVAYDNQRATLHVEFRDGAVYQYFAVPRDTYQDLLRADSKGVYCNQYIRSAFRHAILRVAADALPG